MISNSIHLLESEEKMLKNLGLDSEKLIKLLKQRQKEIMDYKPYHSFNLPILDKQLETLCLDRCYKENLIWGKQSDLNNEYLIHKHTKRDRSEVISEREVQLKKRSFKK